MTSLKNIIWRHPFAVFFYLLITAYNIRVVLVVVDFEKYIKSHPGVSGIAAGGEGVTFASISMFLFAAIFFIVCGIWAIAKRSETKFYLYLGLFAILEPIAFMQIESLFE